MGTNQSGNPYSDMQNRGLFAPKISFAPGRYPLLGVICFLFLTLLALPGYSEKVITVGVYENPPLIFTDEEGEVSGIAVDVLEEIARSEGFEITYLPGTLAECLERLEKEEIDLQPALDYTPQRAQKFDFTEETLLSNWGVVYAHKKSNIESILDLDLKHIAVLSQDNFYQGSGGLLELTEQFKLDCKFIEVNKYETVLRCIELGMADAGLLSRLYQVQISPQSDIARTSIVCNPVDVGFAFPRETHQSLRRLMDRHLAIMKEDPSSIYHQSVQKWLGESRALLFPRWLSITLMVAAGVLLLFVALTIFLRIQVRRKTAEIDAKNQELQADIAERKRAEQALRESDEVYRRAIETATGVPYRLRFGEVYGTGQYEFLGDGIYDLLGIAPDQLDFELFGRLVKEVIFSESTGMVPKEVGQAFLRGELDRYQADIRIVTPQGEEKWLSDSSIPLKDDSDGRVRHSLGILQDITERRRSEESLRERNRQLAIQNAVAQVCTGSLSAEQLCDLLADLVRKVLPCDAFWMDLYDESAMLSRAIRNYDTVDGEFCIQEPMDIPVNKNSRVYQTVIQARKPLLYLRDETNADEISLLRFGDKNRTSMSLIYAPLISGDQVVGKMSVQSYTAKAYHQRDVDLLMAMAQQVGPALEAANLGDQLRRSEENYRRMVDLNPDALYVHAEGEIIFVNSAGAGLMGFDDPQELIGQKTMDFVHPDYRQIASERIRLITEEDASIPLIDQKFIRKDGSFVDVEVASIPVVFQGRLAVQTVVRDITHRKRAEEEREALQRFSQSLTAPFGVRHLGKVVGLESRRLFGHDSFWLEVLNDSDETFQSVYNEDTLSGRNEPSELEPVNVVFAPEIRQQVMQGQARLMNREDRDLEKFSETDQQRFSRSLMFAPIRWENRTIGMVSVQSYTPHRYKEHDLKLLQAFADQCGGALARVRTEEELRRLATAVEQLAESIIITDTEGNIQYVNPAFQSITGFQRLEAEGRNILEFQGNGSQNTFYRNIWGSIRHGRVWTGHIKNRRKDGSFCELDAVVSPIRDSAGKIISYVGVGRDVTKERELEDQLRHAQKMEAIGQLAGGIAHDFNNLLQGIMGYVSLSLKAVSADHPVYPDLNQIKVASERAADLTAQLLAFGRRQVLNPQYVLLNDIVENWMNMLQRLIGENIELEFQADEDLGVVRADLAQIEQVLMNLCVNARDAMPDGGRITIRTENALIDDAFCQAHPWAKRGRYVNLSIQDTGCGIPDSMLEHVFEPFFTTKEVGKGTGLGLATVYGIVKQHGGMVDVGSTEGVGTSFQIYLPIIEGAVAEKREIPVQEEPPGGNETILMAEDEELVRELGVRILKDAGYRVLTAKDGQEAIEIFEKNKDHIDLALLDVVMPKKSGVVVKNQIIESRPGIKFLFSSGYSSTSEEGRFVLRPEDPLISKPYKPSDLLIKVREVLNAVPQSEVAS